jgi:hypothetical protein
MTKVRTPAGVEVETEEYGPLVAAERAASERKRIAFEQLLAALAERPRVEGNVSLRMAADQVANKEWLAAADALAAYERRVAPEWPRG